MAHRGVQTNTPQAVQISYGFTHFCEQSHARGRIEAGRHRRNELNKIESVDEGIETSVRAAHARTV